MTIPEKINLTITLILSIALVANAWAMVFDTRGWLRSEVGRSLSRVDELPATEPERVRWVGVVSLAVWAVLLIGSVWYVAHEILRTLSHQ